MTSSDIHQGAAGRIKALTLGLLVLAAGSFSAAALAQQQVYRIVGPDGKVTFSDQPPPTASKAKVTTTSADGAGAAAAALPFELRKVAGLYPVTLYTGDNCAPCASARSMLNARGIPFSEKTVTTSEDSLALKRISGENMLPFMTIGSQQLKGFSDAEWTQFLDAAGYPKASLLPASYRQVAATPLVTVNAPAAPAPADAAAARPAAPVATTPAAPPPSNPSGIRF